MTEWWTYRPSDFLLFSPRTYHRLFELYNEWLWPAQPLVTLFWLLLWVALWRGIAWAPRVALLVIAAALGLGGLGLSRRSAMPPSTGRRPASQWLSARRLC